MPAGRCCSGRSAERHADDVQSPGEALECEFADLLAAGAERLPVGVAAIGGSECTGDGGQQLMQLRPDLVGERGVALRGFA